MIIRIANIIAFDVYFPGITFRIFIQMLLLIFLLSYYKIQLNLSSFALSYFRTGMNQDKPAENIVEPEDEKFFTTPLIIIFVTVFIDLIGFGMVIPILPTRILGDAL